MLASGLHGESTMRRWRIAGAPCERKGKGVTIEVTCSVRVPTKAHLLVFGHEYRMPPS